MEWIKCSEQMPKRGRVLVYFPTDSTSPMDSLYDGRDFHVDGMLRTKSVTHWMPLPSPPEVQP